MNYRPVTVQLAGLGEVKTCPDGTVEPYWGCTSDHMTPAPQQATPAPATGSTAGSAWYSNINWGQLITGVGNTVVGVVKASQGTGQTATGQPGPIQAYTPPVQQPVVVQSGVPTWALVLGGLVLVGLVGGGIFMARR